MVGFGSTAVDLTGFSSATIDADTALRSLDVDSKEGTALYDAVRLSAQSLRTEPADARVIIVLTDGRDASSTASLSRAVAAARAARATVYPVGIESDQFSPAPLRQIAKADRRLVPQRGRAPGSCRAMYAQIARELRLTWRIQYLTAALPGDRVRLQASVPGHGSASATARIPAPGGSAAPDAGGSLAARASCCATCWPSSCSRC